MSHSYSPVAAYSQMDENKQDLPKKLSEPFDSSCQFESAGSEAFSSSERGRKESEGRNGGGGGLVVVVLWGLRYSVQVQDSRGGKLFPGDAMVAICRLRAPPGAEL